MSGAVHRQRHGYKNGHQLLAGTVKLSRTDQDLVDRLSDISGPIRPGQLFEPYLTFYPLPSESYFVIAKTWQDRDAPRAGCVITQSVFLASEFWERGEGVRQAFAYLSKLTLDTESSLTDDDERDYRPLPSVGDERLPALVEALFLEDRKPIVVFDPRSSELITERLLLSLWPSARQSFAVCTFALGARKIGGRDFDLVFAPNEARSKFADWTGRRIESGASAAPARHRWTTQVVERIFLSEAPSLPLSSLPDVLQRGDRNDESVLRLSLLWEELSQRASSSKTAALGLLDILNSQNVRLAAAPQMKLVLDHAIGMAEVSTDAEDAWSFLTALSAKISPSELTLFSERLTDAAMTLTRRDPMGSTANVSALRTQNRDIPKSLLRGLGEGLATPELNVAASNSFQLSTDLMMALFAASPGFAHALLSPAALENTAYAADLAQEIAQSDSDRRRELRANILPCLSSPEAVDILKALLRTASPDDVLEAVETIARKTRFEESAFDAPLIEAAIDADALVAVRNLAIDYVDLSGADRFLLATLRAEEGDVLWLAALNNVDRRNALAKEFVDRLDQRDLMRLLRHTAARDELLAMLAEDPQTTASQLTRVLASANTSITRTAELGIAAWPWIGSSEREQLATRALERTMRDSKSADWPLTDRFFAVAAPSLSGRQLVQFASPATAPAPLVGHNIALLDSVKPVAKMVTPYLSELTERLVRRFDNLGPDAYVAWARLLSNADPREASTVHVAAATFEYAMQVTRFPASPLAAAAFPIFYRHLPTKKEVGLFWTEIDRRKSARRLLVDAFTDSKWPPADLILTAIEADITEKVVGLISRGYRAEAYVTQITNDAERLEPRLRKAVLKALQSEFDLDY
ncbi:MAG: hypothetical protein DCF16_09470 [Alphaproteobacteria bacterium]|nr:MAG: hypothetical protein DCF16_09470 [Alphaproteobacteria bacterium]